MSWMIQQKNHVLSGFSVLVNGERHSRELYTPKIPDCAVSTGRAHCHCSCMSCADLLQRATAAAQQRDHVTAAYYRPLQYDMLMWCAPLRMNLCSIK